MNSFHKQLRERVIATGDTSPGQWNLVADVALEKRRRIHQHMDDAPKPSNHRPWVREYCGDKIWHWYPEPTGPACCGREEITGTPYVSVEEPWHNVCHECARQWEMVKHGMEPCPPK